MLTARFEFFLLLLLWWGFSGWLLGFFTVLFPNETSYENMIKKGSAKEITVNLYSAGMAVTLDEMLLTTFK